MPIKGADDVWAVKGDDEAFRRAEAVFLADLAAECSGDNDPENPAAKELSLLRERGYYALGLPQQIDGHEQAYNRTLDIVFLVHTLMQQDGVPPCLLVANLATDTRPTEEARLLGLKDLIFYEAIQDLLLEMEPGLKRLPVVLLSDIDHLPGFAEKRTAVGDLFNSNSEFREAVYACVPERQRHRRHREKTYAQLQALGNDSIVEAACKKSSYVLDQVSRVSQIGAKKWGHVREKPYDEATALAEQLLASDGEGEENRTEFGTVSPVFKVGDVPYRAAAGFPNANEVPGLLSSFGRLEDLWDTLRAFVKTRRIPIDQTNALLKEAELKCAEAQAELPPNQENIAKADGWRKKLLEAMQIMVSSFVQNVIKEHQRLSKPIGIFDEFLIALRHKFMDQLQAHPKIVGAERSQVEAAYMRQTERESYLARASGPNVLDYVLMKRMGILAVLNDEAPESSIAGNSGKWLPFVAEPPSKRLPYAYVPFIVSGLLFGPGAPHESRANDADEILASDPKGYWVIPHAMFVAMLFAPLPSARPPETAEEVTRILDTLVEPAKQSRWRVFDEFISAIEGTPVEKFYDGWMAMMMNRDSPKLEPLPVDFLRSDRAHRIRALLENPFFREDFRKDFLHIMSGQ